MARVRDVIDEDEWKMRPISAVLLLVACGFSGLIIWNGLAHQKGGAGQVATSNPDAPAVVLKYDPAIEDAQRELLALGVYKGPVDGVDTKTIKNAIIAYQQINGLPKTGEISPDLIAHMKFAHKIQSAAEFTGSPGPVDVAAVSQPEIPGLVTAPKPVADAAAVKSQSSSVKKVQIALAGLGYELKAKDGVFNAETRSAILKYQMDNGLDMNGSVDKPLLTSLKVQ